MKILFAADGSRYTKKALGFVLTHEGLLGEEGELVVVHVEPPAPPRVKSLLGARVVAEYQREEAQKVLAPIEKFLRKHAVKFRTVALVGHPPLEIVRMAKREKAQMILMGTHGHGLMGRVLMGSVAQNVVTQSDIPVLLVK
ncbi:MAG TPA: universal stress protein [Ramlibacter sp.]|uniref:universal stress protein n=1 Tax=Ramlibacter sp. TaxID=1917967 RepID=UPI002B978E4D|nr:universal stress protein [Ramlibacter sp.]HVZ43426.1 universal stress protein [Ramlibacter sp.]